MNKSINWQKKTPPLPDVDSIYTEVTHDGKEITFTGAPDNELETTETDKGQLILERNFGVLKSPKKTNQIFEGFLP